MKKTYKILAYAVCVEVVIQAAAIAWAFAGLGHWVAGGGVLDSAAMESEEITYPGLIGLITHGINGSIVIPVIALALFVLSFFAKVPGGVKWSAIVLGLVVVQTQLGYLAHDVPAVGALHGVNALLIFTSALIAARLRVGVPAPEPAAAP